MHSEEEARKLWCPMVRLSEDNSTDNRSASAGFVRNDEPGAGIKWNCCIASDCALWVWDEDEHGVCKQSGTGEPMRGRCGLVRR